MKKQNVLLDCDDKSLNIVRSLKSNDETLIGLYVGVWAGDGTQFYDNGYCINPTLTVKN